MSDDISIPPPGYYNQRSRVSEPPAGTFGAGRIALIILAAVGVGAIGASVIHYRSGPVPVIQADTNPIRVRPDDAGGQQVAGANNNLLIDDSDPTDSRLAPPPEEPNPQALRSPPSPAVVSPPAPAALPAALPASGPAAALPAPPAPRPKPPAAVAPASAALPLPPAARPAVYGKAIIQLAALETEAAARTEWHTLSKRFPDLLSGHEPVFSKIERAGKTYWRVRTAGFPDTEHAKAACEKIRAKGGTCSVADF